MRTRLLILLILTLSLRPAHLLSQTQENAQVYLVTCAPGTETYSIYGHSALRIIMPEKSSDMVYNWGVFDFATPNFAWKFAKGRLDYLLQAYPADRFLQEYFYEQRAVFQQRINLEPAETQALLTLISENLKPENISYRYDFFYDDCSTRIRDLLEKATGNRLIYPPEKNEDAQTFRQKVGEYQRSYPWLEFGINLIMGTPGEKKATFRDEMFLPVDLQKNLSETLINREGRLVPFLTNPEILLDFPPASVKSNFILSPVFVFSLLLVIIILLSALKNNILVNRIMDLSVYIPFSILSVLIFFFSFFTDHEQMKLNLNILWLSPFVIMCLTSLLLNRKWVTWYRITFTLSLIFIIIILVFPAGFSKAFLPLAIILALRTAARSDFSWNPLSVSTI